ncbi:TatD family hydrolase, partial [Variovorax sp. CT11-76]
MFTDSHCHLTFPEFADQMDAVRAAMAAAQVDRALCICTRLEEFDEVQALAARYDNFWASVGVHPDTEDTLEPSVDDLVRLA